MSILEIVLLCLVIWLTGALVVIQIEERWPATDLAALAVWPVLVPVALAIHRWRRWAFTCRDCKKYYGDRKHYDLHMVHRTNCTVPPAEPTEEW